MFGLPQITTYGSPPTPGEVVGIDPWDDDDDATYARGGAAGDFHHITATIEPTTVAGSVVFTFRASATQVYPDGIARFVANLYPAGWSSAGQAAGDETTPPLNFTAGSNPVYVQVPVVDGTPQDIPVAIYDWNTETPATAEQIETYFAAGGVLLIQPSTFGGGGVDLTIYRIAAGATLVITGRADSVRRRFISA